MPAERSPSKILRGDPARKIRTEASLDLANLLYLSIIDSDYPPASDEHAWKTIYGDLPEPVIELYFGSGSGSDCY